MSTTTTLAIIVAAAIILAAILSCIPTRRVSNTLEDIVPAPTTERERRYHESNQFGR